MIKKISITIFVFSVLILSGLHNYYQPMHIEILQKNPNSNEGKVLTLSGYVIEINDKYYTVYDGPYNKKIIIFNYTKNWKEGDFVSIKGIFHKEGYVEYIEGEIIWDRKIKLVLSSIGFLSVLLIIYIDRKKLIISI